MCAKKDILSTLAYFNLFDYPLRKREILTFLGSERNPNEFEQALETLTEESAIFKVGDFYSLCNNDALLHRRSRGNAKASAMLKKAERAAALIASFPFVRGVAVSGSLSKNFAEDSSDIDFFIITCGNRLWIARTLLHVFKKFTYLLNQQHYYCMNYFIDEEGLDILEKNVYTAVETTTILPLRGIGVFEDFYKANKWTKHFLPNNYMRVSSTREIKTTWLKSLAEKLLDNRIGNLLDNFLMKLTDKSWKIKTQRGKKNCKGMAMRLHTGKHFSKPHPENFQKNLLDRYENTLSEVLLQYELSFTKKKDLI